MDDDAFNMSMRKFLKRVGVTSQQEIEKAVRAAEAAGTLGDRRAISAKVVLTLDGVPVEHVVEGQIALQPGADEDGAAT